jgi:hypothetical protein
MIKLREAAQFLLTAVEHGHPDGTKGMDATLDALREALREDALVFLSETHQQLDAALAEKSEEYELIGTIDGTYAGRWMLAAFAENASAVWPDGTAIYVRRRVKE